MLLLRTLAPVLLLAFIGQQVSLSSARRPDKSASSSADRSAAASGGKGKFFTKDKMQCAWTAKDAAGGAVKVHVKCENPEARVKGGTTDMECDYDGKPQKCPGYQSDAKGFWKQVGRAFKRLQAKVCRDERALVKAGMCKRAPRDAHFKLDIRSSVSSAQSGGWEPETLAPRPNKTTTIVSTSTNCTSRADQEKTAEEYCSSQWASVCAFFLSVLQSGDC